VFSIRYSLVFLFLLTAGIEAAETQVPPLPPLISPIKRFREWLQLPEAERQKALAEYPESKKKVLQAKLRFYGDLPSEERDRRLRMVELRWYLRPLMTVPADQRTQTLAVIPAEYKEIVEQRLQAWDRLSPELREQLMESELSMQYLTRVSLKLTPQTEAALVEPLTRQWSKLSPAEKQRATAQFNRFFELAPEEKQKTLKALSDSERQEMESTLKAFEKLPAEQRHICIVSFQKFATMPVQEKRQFLKNAARWQAMSPKERNLWHELVTSLPPMPPGDPMLPPTPDLSPPLPKTASNAAPGVPIN
jgi:hypothetical protein